MYILWGMFFVFAGLLVFSVIAMALFVMSPRLYLRMRLPKEKRGSILAYIGAATLICLVLAAFTAPKRAQPTYTAPNQREPASHKAR